MLLPRALLALDEAIVSVVVEALDHAGELSELTAGLVDFVLAAAIMSVLAATLYTTII